MLSALWTACLTSDWDRAEELLGEFHEEGGSTSSDDFETEAVRERELAVLTEAVTKRERPKPFVGLSASFGHGGDSYPYVVVWVSKSGHRIYLASPKHKDDWTEPKGPGLYDPKAAEVFMRKRNGRYSTKGSYARQPSVHFGTEQKKARLDPHY